MTRPYIIGIGTIDRGDDAAGLLVARRLRELGLEAAEHNRDGLSLLESWQGYGHVILIDAVVTGAAPGTITRWGDAEPVIPDAVHSSTHAFGVAEALQLARALGRMPPRLDIYGIEAAEFAIGAQPSPAILEAVETLTSILAAEKCG